MIVVYVSRESQAEGESKVDQIYSAESSICSDRSEENECDPNEMSDDDGITFTEEDDDNLETCVIDMDTMLGDYEPIIPQPDEPHLAFPTIFVGKRDQIIVIEFIKFITVTYASMN